MSAFKCWAPDCEDEKDGDTIRTETAQSAAEQCAEKVWRAGGRGELGECEIHVRDEAGELTRWTISMDTTVYFTARPVAVAQEGARP